MNEIELARAIEWGEAAAYADLYASAPAPIAARLGVRVARLGSAVCLIAPGTELLLFNRVLGLGLDEPVTEECLDTIIAEYRSAGVSDFAIPLCPQAQPAADLADWLRVRGLLPRDRWSKVIRGSKSAPVVETNLRVLRIEKENAGTFGRILCEVLALQPSLGEWVAETVGRAGWRHYIAVDGRSAVACGALFVSRPIGWLGMGATLTSYRRRGAQSAIMGRRILDGGAVGCKRLVTETSEDTPQYPNPSYHNMIRTGFTLVYQRTNYGYHRTCPGP
jgi:hypothetical protein